MEELMKKYDHLSEEMKRRIKTFIASKGIVDPRNSDQFKRMMINLERKINTMIQLG